MALPSCFAWTSAPRLPGLASALPTYPSLYESTALAPQRHRPRLIEESINRDDYIAKSHKKTRTSRNESHHLFFIEPRRHMILRPPAPNAPPCALLAFLLQYPSPARLSCPSRFALTVAFPSNALSRTTRARSKGKAPYGISRAPSGDSQTIDRCDQGARMTMAPFYGRSMVTVPSVPY